MPEVLDVLTDRLDAEPCRARSTWPRRWAAPRAPRARRSDRSAPQARASPIVAAMSATSCARRNGYPATVDGDRSSGRCPTSGCSASVSLDDFTSLQPVVPPLVEPDDDIGRRRGPSVDDSLL